MNPGLIRKEEGRGIARVTKGVEQAALRGIFVHGHAYNLPGPCFGHSAPHPSSLTKDWTR